MGWILVTVLAAAPVLVPFGYWLALAVLLAWGLAVRWRGQPPYSVPPTAEQAGAAQPHGAWLGAALLCFALGEALAGYWHTDWLAAWPTLAAGALAALSWALGRRLVIPLGCVWAGFALGGMGAGGWALWQALVDGAWRANGHAPLHAIFFGNVALLSGLLCLAGLGWVWSRRGEGERLVGWWLLMLAGAAGGLLASVLSGTRGGWIALPLALLVFYRGYLRGWAPRWRWACAAIVLSLLLAVYATPQTGVQNRVSEAREEVHDYLAGNARGSVGTRLEMYRGAGLLILDQPYLGLGHQGYQPRMQALVEAERLPAGLDRYWHAHNELLDAWVRRGLLGLVAVLALYLVPLWHFSRQLSTGDPARRATAVAGMLIPVAFIDFGLSYAFFAYPVGIAVYAVWLALFWRASGKHTAL
ncbi:hypothetical protein BWR19_10070 [Halomonas sp. 1513]|nr:O-antigen ligase family protein [Halomonas sp. 1513]APX93249.1 hypothetical protein BWR19_10070 [Halomonas sp. 1513]